AAGLGHVHAPLSSDVTSARAAARPLSHIPRSAATTDLNPHRYATSTLPALLPDDSMVEDPGGRVAGRAAQAAEHQSQHEVTRPAPQRPRRLAAAALATQRDDFFHAVAPQGLIRGERLLEVRTVAQAACEYHRIFNRHRRSLPR